MAKKSIKQKAGKRGVAHELKEKLDRIKQIQINDSTQSIESVWAFDNQSNVGTVSYFFDIWFSFFSVIKLKHFYMNL